ncbi:F0F1 ATP synthase subunit delta [Ideonella sp. A 288]|uniref:F0F1 ATP synthase subunit delta n=1 Tax=Ideonella sp. A 288 TaxID=1962181 RepID=UPI000B4B3C55|nr:F0F1 ATP synthase subunit delta [Ideonella sp. A 288]
MAELATIARPYAEALYKAVGLSEAQSVATQVDELAQVASDERLRVFADDPRTQVAQVFDVVASATRTSLGNPAKNLLQTVLENGRLAVLPEIAAQFKALLNARSGSSDAVIQSAFPIDADALVDVVASLERRFGRKLNARVEVDAELIGGIRVVVGDEVLDTSVKARLEQMKVALTA